MDKIESILKQLELDYSIDIIYASEVGSRLWGYSNNESDYDIKFIYKYPLTSYLNVTEPKSVIDTSLHSKYELHGWDILKALKLFRNSNPSLYEWLFSPMKYRNVGNTSKQLKAIASDHYSFKKLSFHYLHLVKNNLKKKIKGEKDYIHIVRGYLTVRYILEYNVLPPLHIYELLKYMKFERKEALKEIYQLLERESFRKDEKWDGICSLIITDLPYIEEKVKELKDHKMNDKVINQILWNELRINEKN